MHDTALSSSVLPGLGLDETVQAVPFQDSMRLGTSCEPNQYSPTALHEEAEIQDTALRKSLVPSRPATLGLETIDQTEPFQDSMKVSSKTP